MNFTEDELVCIIGTLMRDLRGNWGYDYESRIKALKLYLNELSKINPTLSSDVNTVLDVCNHQLNADGYDYIVDGRFFRDEPFYNKSPVEGRTERVKAVLYSLLTHPEYSWLEEDEND